MGSSYSSFESPGQTPTVHTRSLSSGQGLASFGIAEDPDREERKKRGLFFGVGMAVFIVIAGVMISRSSSAHPAAAAAPPPKAEKPTPAAVAPAPPPPPVAPVAEAPKEEPKAAAAEAPAEEKPKKGKRAAKHKH